MSYPPIFIIALKRTPERLLNIQRQLDALNLSYQVVYAIDEYDLQSKLYRLKIARQLGMPEPMIEYRYENRAKWSGLGILLSHAQIYNSMIKNQIPTACILEDDVEIPSIFPKILIAAQKFPWDILLLANQSDASARLVNILVEHLKPKAVIFKIFNALMDYKKDYPLLTLNNAHRIKVITRCFFDIIELYLRHYDSYEKIMLKIFNRKWTFERKQYTERSFWEYYACVMGALTVGDKSSMRRVLGKYYLAEPYEPAYSNMAYMLNLTAAKEWRAKAFSGDFEHVDKIFGSLSAKDAPKIYILSPPCVIPTYRYLSYSARRTVASIHR